jgi:hypothetical protein
VFMYVFDAVLMWAVMVVMAWIHLSEIAGLLNGGKGKALRRVISVHSLH